MNEISVRRAGIDDLDALTRLFDAYRQFYEQPSDMDGARRFLGERIARMDSTIFLAEDSGDRLGFCQLFPSFTSTGMARTYILNDLFVSPDGRGRGVGKALLHAAVKFGFDEGAVRLTLSTAHENKVAQSLYAACGWKRDEDFIVFHRRKGDMEA